LCRAEFGIVMVYFYICDRTNIFPESKKVIMLFLLVTIDNQHYSKWHIKLQ